MPVSSGRLTGLVCCVPAIYNRRLYDSCIIVASDCPWSNKLSLVYPPLYAFTMLGSLARALPERRFILNGEIDWIYMPQESSAIDALVFSPPFSLGWLMLSF